MIWIDLPDNDSVTLRLICNVLLELKIRPITEDVFIPIKTSQLFKMDILCAMLYGKVNDSRTDIVIIMGHEIFLTPFKSIKRLHLFLVAMPTARTSQSFLNPFPLRLHLCAHPDKIICASDKLACIEIVVERTHGRDCQTEINANDCIFIKD